MNGCRRVRPRWSTVGRRLVARASVRLARPQNTRSFHGPAFARAAFAHSTAEAAARGRQLLGVSLKTRSTRDEQATESIRSGFDFQMKGVLIAEPKVAEFRR